MVDIKAKAEKALHDFIGEGKDFRPGPQGVQPHPAELGGMDGKSLLLPGEPYRRGVGGAPAPGSGLPLLRRLPPGAAGRGPAKKAARLHLYSQRGASL